MIPVSQTPSVLVASWNLDVVMLWYTWVTIPGIHLWDTDTLILINVTVEAGGCCSVDVLPVPHLVLPQDPVDSGTQCG